MRFGSASVFRSASCLLSGGRQADDARRGGRGRRNRPAALSGLPYRLLFVVGSQVSLIVVWTAARLDRADLRVRRAVPDRLRGRGDQPPPRLDRGRERIHPAPRQEEPGALRVLRGRHAGRGDDALRGLFLFVGGRRGTLGARRTSRSTRANAILGFGLGGLLSMALISDERRASPRPRHRSSSYIGTTALGAEVPLVKPGLIFAMFGILLAVGGAAVDTSFSGAYRSRSSSVGSGASTAGQRGATCSRSDGSSCLRSLFW